MFYKTKKDSETGLKFQIVSDKMKKVFEEQKELSNKYNFTQWRGGRFVLNGGISAVVFPDDFKIDLKVWKKVNTKYSNNEYYPKLSSKIGKTIIDDFNNLPYVTLEELNNCISFNEFNSSHIGFGTNKEYFGFTTKEEWNVNIPEDCEEITKKEFDKLFVNN